MVGVVGNTSLIECADQRQVLQGEGLLRDRRGRPRRVLRLAELRRRQHGPALQQHRRRRRRSSAGAKSLVVSVAAPRWPTYANGGQSSSSRRRPGHQGRQRARTCRSPTRTRSCSSWCRQAGTRRRRDPRLHARVGDAAAEGRERPGRVDKVKWGSSTPVSERVRWPARSPAFDGKISVNSEFGLLDRQGAGHDAVRAINGQVRAERPDPELRPDGLPGRQVRDQGAAHRQGRR